MQPPVPTLPIQPSLPPTTGPGAIAYALSKINLEGLRQQHMDIIKSGAKSKRAKSVHALNAIEGLSRNNLTPDKLMISSVPVIPPSFRPFSVLGSTFVSGAANELYRDLFQYRDMYKETADLLGDKGASQARLDLFDTARALYGYGEPIAPKTKQRGVAGFLKQITGAHAKESFVQRKLLSKTQDSVSRGTISVNPDLSLDEIGVPLSMAWVMYAPYIQRRLVQNGMSPSDALRNVKDRSDFARRALDQEVGKRPVIYSRAPSWHKFNVLAGKPKLIDGDTIAVNPLVTTGLSADFDGNCIKIGTNVLVKWETSVTTGLNADFDQFVSKVSVDNVSATGIDSDMSTPHNTEILVKNAEHIVMRLPIQSFPHTAQAQRAKDGGLIYTVPDGLSVLTNTPDGKGVRWSPVTSFTEDGVKPTCKVTTSNKEVSVSDNESLAVYSVGGTLKRVSPLSADIKAYLVPTLLNLPISASVTKTTDYEFGWLVGAFVSDGWIDTTGRTLGYAKLDPVKRARFLDALTMLLGQNVTSRTYREQHEALTNCGISGGSEKLHVDIRYDLDNPERTEIFSILATSYTVDRKLNPTKRACLFKKLPDGFLGWSIDRRIGLLAGLIDGDGSLAISNGKSKPQVVANYSTSSAALRDDVQLLCLSLGVRTSYCEVHPKAGRVQRETNYVMTPSTVDLAKISDKLIVSNDYAAPLALLLQGLNKDDRDIVPIEASVISDVYNNIVPALTKGSWATKKSQVKAAGVGYAPITRTMAKKLIELYPQFLDNPGWRELVLVTNDITMGWERILEVEAEGDFEVFDLGVPETKVYALANGLIIYDTMNVHVPSMDDSVKEAYDKLLPSKMLFSIRDQEKVVPVPKQELILGLYTANMRPSKNTHQFDTEEDALSAIRAGKLSLSDDVTIGKPTPTPTTPQPNDLPDKLLQ